MITGIHHIQLGAPPNCEDTARRFYGDLLGMLEIPKPPELAKRGGVWFELGEGQQVHLGVQADFVAPQKAHPALCVVGLAELRARLEAAGCPTESDALLVGYARFYARDPFGNRLEFVEPLARE